MSRAVHPPPGGRAEEPRPRRKRGSIVLKLTMGQFSRTLGILLRLDLLLVLLCFALTFAHCERTAGALAALPPDEALARAGALEDVEAWEGEALRGIALTPRIQRWVGAPADAVRRVALVSDPGYSPLRLWNRHPYYEVSVPRGEGGALVLRFDLGGGLRRFAWGALIVAAAEILMLLGATGRARREARNTLAPLQMLAQAANTMSAEPEAAPVPDELELSGAIDTLNRITAKALDTRIAIDDEREELRDLAGAINGMLDRLDAAYSSQLRFVSDASHELRTPIAVIQGYANLLDRWGKEDPAALQESIDAIKAEAENMKTLVEQLLFLARSDNNSIVLQRRRVDVAALAAEVLRDTQVIDGDHQFISDIGEPVWVEGDAGLLKQALRIFMDNAVKYTPPGERIKVSACLGEDGARVSVTDNGIGIPAADLPHVFERFFRSDESRARTTGGTGLGLAIARWTIQRHGGHVEILSREDIGTRLTMVLPATQAAPGGGEAAPA